MFFRQLNNYDEKIIELINEIKKYNLELTDREKSIKCILLLNDISDLFLKKSELLNSQNEYIEKSIYYLKCSIHLTELYINKKPTKEIISKYYKLVQLYEKINKPLMAKVMFEKYNFKKQQFLELSRRRGLFSEGRV